MSKICVIGSSSMDLVVTSPKRPAAGETVLGESFKTVPGGKGANQAVAAARLGAEVHMIGCVGDDHYGKAILDNFQANGVLTDYVEPVTGQESGTAHIVLADGDNSIIVVKGANDHVTPEYVQKALPAIKQADIVLIQQEIPEETVDYVSGLCSSLGIPLLLNPAPARPLRPETVDLAAYITPNEHEASVLFQGMSREEALKRYPEKLFITEGKTGSAITMVWKKGSSLHSLSMQLIRREPETPSMRDWPLRFPKDKASNLPCALRTGRLPSRF